MCDFCGKEWVPIETCPDEWVCPDCGKHVSPCCGAQIGLAACDSECEMCDYCGDEACDKCHEHCHCGGCI